MIVFILTEPAPGRFSEFKNLCKSDVNNFTIWINYQEKDKIDLFYWLNQLLLSFCILYKIKEEL